MAAATDRSRAARLAAFFCPAAFVLLWVVAFARPATSQEPLPSDAEVLGTPASKTPPATIEQVRARLTFFDQHGRGYQSKAGPAQGPGSERLTVWQPALSLIVRQRNSRFSHSIAATADVVTAASPDALDAVSSASRWNEGATVAVTSRFQTRSGRGEWNLLYGPHIEEHWWTGFVGLGYSHFFLDRSTTLTVNANFVFDIFNVIDPRGNKDGETQRWTTNANATIVQILSPTTLGLATYGFTDQRGTLENGWNSVYIEGSPPTPDIACPDDPDQLPEYDCVRRQRENLPETRQRHALAFQLNQHIPRTRSTIKLGYRYYFDTFDLRGFTTFARYYQWVLPQWIYLRFEYRFHFQTGVSFYTRSVPLGFPQDEALTADSDLDRFYAHQAGLKAVFYLRPVHGARGAQAVDLGYSHYLRTNNLRMHVFSIGFSQDF